MAEPTNPTINVKPKTTGEDASLPQVKPFNPLSQASAQISANSRPENLTSSSVAPLTTPSIPTIPPTVPPLPPRTTQLPPTNMPPPPIGTIQNRPAVPVQSSPFKFIIPLLGIGIVVVLVVLLGQKLFSSKINNNGNAPISKNNVTTITYWGLWEPSIIMQEVITKFEAQNPGIKVNYQQESIKDYRERLQNSLEGKGGEAPDIFRFHTTWTSLLANDLAAIPSSIMTAKEFESEQYPVVQDWLKTSKGYVGLPLMYEGLGLFYNQEIFTAAGKTPPKTWEELRRLAVELTIKDKQDVIQRAGIALGSTSNVDNWSDILGLMLLQNAANPSKPNNQLGQDAMTFFELFTKTDKVWSNDLPASTVAFANGKVAMIIAPSWRAHDVKNMNPNLKFAIAAVPQLPDTQVSWASIWAEGVNSHSDRTKQEAAWKLISFMNQKDTLRNFFAAASKQRLFGEIFARTDMTDQLNTDPMLGAFIQQASTAKSWFLCSQTFDNGPNDKIIKYYEDGLNAMQKGDTAAKVLDTVEQGVNQVVQQYKLPVLQ